VSSSLCWSIHDAHVLAGYRRLLRDNDDSLIDMRLDRRIDIWTATLVDARVAVGLTNSGCGILTLRDPRSSASIDVSGKLIAGGTERKSEG
jgi:hypothetical protein